MNIKNDETIRNNWKAIEHSLSPVLHNYWFKKYKIDANYSLINVDDDGLSNLIEKDQKKKIQWH